MKKQFPLLVMTLLIPLFSFSQVATTEMKRVMYGNPMSDYHQNSIRSLGILEEDNSFDEHFIFSEWTSLTAKGVDSLYLEADSSNYLIDHNVILFHQDGELLKLFPEYIESVRMGDKVFKPYTNNSGNKAKYQYYEVLAEGDKTLLKSYTVREENVSSNPMGIKDTNETKLTQKSELFYIDRKGELKKLPNKKKEIIELFTYKRNSIITYAKDNDLSPKKEGDLAKLFKYSNSLKASK